MIKLMFSMSEDGNGKQAKISCLLDAFDNDLTCDGSDEWINETNSKMARLFDGQKICIDDFIWFWLVEVKANE